LIIAPQNFTFLTIYKLTCKLIIFICQHCKCTYVFTSTYAYMYACAFRLGAGGGHGPSQVHQRQSDL